MQKISQYPADHPLAERFFYWTIIFCAFYTAFVNCKMALDILHCDATPDFLALFDSRWINQALIGKIVLKLMQHYYAGTPILILIVSCLNPADLFLLFGTPVYLLQINLKSGLKRRQNWIKANFIIRFSGFFVLMIFLGLAITSLTTANGFYNLQCGAIGYLVFNIISMLCSGLSILIK